MIGLHCRDRHRTKRGLCDACGALWEYVQERIEHCPFDMDKPTCLNCTVHCFKPAMRESIRTVMRYAGPRMMTRHPLLAVLHLVDGRRPAPAPRKQVRGRSGPSARRRS